jgi:cellulose synthase/poly-beta-1,6-N-acetylglucosamine synthase-like glycosyltransferase
MFRQFPPAVVTVCCGAAAGCRTASVNGEHDRERGVTSVSGDELVTVVIPALNEERFLGECLDSVRAQDYRSLQIIVVDGGSTDGTVALIESRIAEDERIELLHNDQRNIPSSLNLALDHARGAWLVRVDAHSTVGQGLCA